MEEKTSYKNTETFLYISPIESIPNENLLVLDGWAFDVEELLIWESESENSLPHNPYIKDGETLFSAEAQAKLYGHPLVKEKLPSIKQSHETRNLAYRDNISEQTIDKVIDFLLQLERNSLEEIQDARVEFLIYKESLPEIEQKSLEQYEISLPLLIGGSQRLLFMPAFAGGAARCALTTQHFLWHFVCTLRPSASRLIPFKVTVSAHLHGFKLGAIRLRQIIQLPGQDYTFPYNSTLLPIKESANYILHFIFHHVLAIFLPWPISTYVLSNLVLITINHMEFLAHYHANAYLDSWILRYAVGREDILIFCRALYDTLLHLVANINRSAIYSGEIQIMIDAFNYYLDIELDMPTNAILRAANNNLSTIIMGSIFSALMLRTDWRSNSYVNRMIDLFTNIRQPVFQQTGPSRESHNQDRQDPDQTNLNNNNENRPNIDNVARIAQFVFEDTEGRTNIVNSSRSRTTFFRSHGENEAETNTWTTPSFEQAMLRLGLILLIIMHLGSMYINTTNNGPKM